MTEKRGRNVVIIGDHGVGKTSLLIALSTILSLDRPSFILEYNQYDIPNVNIPLKKNMKLDIEFLHRAAKPPSQKEKDFKLNELKSNYKNGTYQSTPLEEGYLYTIPYEYYDPQNPANKKISLKILDIAGKTWRKIFEAVENKVGHVSTLDELIDYWKKFSKNEIIDMFKQSKEISPDPKKIDQLKNTIVGTLNELKMGDMIVIMVDLADHSNVKKVSDYDEKKSEDDDFFTQVTLPLKIFYLIENSDAKKKLMLLVNKCDLESWRKHIRENPDILMDIKNSMMGSPNQSIYEEKKNLSDIFYNYRKLYREYLRNRFKGRTISVNTFELKAEEYELPTLFISARYIQNYGKICTFNLSLFLYTVGKIVER